MDNVIIANFNGHLHAVTDPLWRYDEGMRLQFEGVDLPAAYQVHFANEKDGDAIPVYGDETGAEIPYELLEDGYNVYAWVYVTGDGYGRTKYVAQIPVMIKARPSEEEPSPVQQSALDEAINAVNEAAENLESATANIPSEINAALEAAKESGEFDGADGQDGTRIWWTTARVLPYGSGGGVATRQLNGVDGATPAVRDYVFAPEIEQSGEPTTLYVITQTTAVATAFDRICSIKGDPGEDGTSPSITITEITGGHRITITDEVHPEGQSFDVMDGQSGSGTVDDDFSDTSENPVQNKVITNAIYQASTQLRNFGLALDSKVDKVAGKGLSTNDFTDSDKAKLDDAASETWVTDQGYITSSDLADYRYITSSDLADYRTAADQDTIDLQQNMAIMAKYTKPAGGIPASDLAAGVIPTVPSNVSSFTNDAGYLTLATLPVYSGGVS